MRQKDVYGQNGQKQDWTKMLAKVLLAALFLEIGGRPCRLFLATSNKLKDGFWIWFLLRN